MKRTLYSESHELFRGAFRSFIAREVEPHQARWRAEHRVDREVYRKAGEAGFLCTWLEQEHGGPGGDFLHAAIVGEELARAYETGFVATLHSDIVAPYLRAFGSARQKQHYLPQVARGELILAIAMTEPGAGSDLAALSTSATRAGDTYVLRGSKSFVSNGQIADLIVVAARTPSSRPEGGLSLFLVPSDTKGLVRGKTLEKIGLHAQDTSDLHFDDCRIPVENRLGPEGVGMLAMMRNLQQERLVIAISAQASAERVLEDTVAYVKERKVFGRPLSELQNTQFKLAELATQIEVGRCFLDAVVARHARGESLLKESSMAKLYQTELASKVSDECLQLFGGAGYMSETPVARAYVDARAQRIFAGTSEIMKLIIARELRL